MAMIRALLFFILHVAFVLHLVQSNPVFFQNVVESPSPGKIDCDGACAARCKLSSRPNLCKRACGTCCARCGCVPPGTAGNYDACPCYANMTTRGGRHKCP